MTDPRHSHCLTRRQLSVATLLTLAGCGGGGSADAPVSVAPAAPLPAPSGLQASASSSSSIQLSWNAVPSATQYVVERSGVAVATGAATSYLDQGLAANSPYSYRVAAVSAAGATGTFSAAVTATTLASAPPPAGQPTSDRPRGLFVLGSTDVANEVAPLDFIDGVAVRLGWDAANPADGTYDFALIDQTLAALQAGRKRLNVEAFAVTVPAWVLASVPEADQWDAHAPGGATVRTSVPWNAATLLAWEKFMLALADHRVPLADGTLVRFADHPTLMIVDAPIVGLQGVRDLTGTLTTLPGYSRTAFIDAVARSVRASRSAFRDKFGFLAFFKMNDTAQTPALDQELMDRLATEFNIPGQPTLGYFQENLSDAGPTPSGLGSFLAAQKDRTYIMFQALTAWSSPFTGADKVTSGQAAVGIEYAYRNYGSTYVEIYLADVRDAAQTERLRLWANVLRGLTPAP